jgi:uncharacterized YigZ family protein
MINTDILKPEDFYLSIYETKRYETKIKGSKFIATVQHVRSKDEAEAFLDTVRAEFYDATHNCFAYKIGADGLEFRSSDDGEPSGSAGKPILFSINKFNLSDIAVVVTRYFGGTKLGVGGLARAYGGTAEEVLETCPTQQVFKIKPIKVFCGYEDLSICKKLVEENSVLFEDHYTDSVEFLAKLPISNFKNFPALITDKTAGRAGTQIQNNIETIYSRDLK